MECHYAYISFSRGLTKHTIKFLFDWILPGNQNLAMNFLQDITSVKHRQQELTNEKLLSTSSKEFESIESSKDNQSKVLLTSKCSITLKTLEKCVISLEKVVNFYHVWNSIFCHKHLKYWNMQKKFLVTYLSKMIYALIWPI